MRRIQVRRSGLGQTAATPTLPTCTSLAAGQTIPQGVLITGGGLATLVGVAGAIFGGDAYRKDFAIAAGVGLVSSFVGGLWAAKSIADAAADPTCQAEISQLYAQSQGAPQGVTPATAAVASAGT